ncbi:hypothetical protein [Mycoplasma sp. E35C]|uniref:hypothetical protein n=1 Tax=Mycoplasma sp. E35C TaxID=2801918 RepID=UPI001CA44CE7|nr:hypothetical protein [Mycoplasma sp. E35C]QZX48961.1 hypothetical protein JJE79_02800 [Mycoplasma sp. E35C]
MKLQNLQTNQWFKNLINNKVIIFIIFYILLALTTNLGLYVYWYEVINIQDKRSFHIYWLIGFAVIFILLFIGYLVLFKPKNEIKNIRYKYKLLVFMEVTKAFLIFFIVVILFHSLFKALSIGNINNYRQLSMWNNESSIKGKYNFTDLNYQFYKENSELDSLNVVWFFIVAVIYLTYLTLPLFRYEKHKAFIPFYSLVAYKRNGSNCYL